METSQHEWQANIDNKKNLTLEDAKFIFEQAEKFLLDVIDTHKSIIDRTNTLLAILLTILISLVGFNVGRIEDANGTNDTLSLSIWVMIIYLFIGGIYLVANIKPIGYWASGSQPQKIFVDSFFKSVIPENSRIIYMYASEIERYQHRIRMNLEINEAKWKIYKNSIFILIGIPIVFSVVYVGLLVLLTT